MMIPNDDYFVKHVESEWGVCEQLDATVRKEEVMHIIKLMRQNLISNSNNQLEEYTLRNIFRTFDLDGNGILSLTEVQGLLSRLGITCSEKHLQALFMYLDTNRSGFIEFEEFCQFILSNPYP